MEAVIVKQFQKMNGLAQIGVEKKILLDYLSENGHGINITNGNYICKKHYMVVRRQLLQRECLICSSKMSGLERKR